MEKEYSSRDMAKLGCNDCKGCSECCREMGDTIILDPFDIYRLTKNLKRSFQELLSDTISLTTKDGMILPYMNMNSDTKSCVFLSSEGRCSIHEFRPGLCRLYPLGRSYEYDDESPVEAGKAKGFHYFIVEDGCSKQNRTKVRVDKWLAVENIKLYEQYVLEWHNFCRKLQSKLCQWLENSDWEEHGKQVNLAVLQLFYIKPYPLTDDFYKEFMRRIAEINGII